MAARVMGGTSLTEYSTTMGYDRFVTVIATSTALEDYDPYIERPSCAHVFS